MYQRPSAPRPIGGVLDDSFRLYRASFGAWWLPSLLSVIAAALLQGAVMLKAGRATVGVLELSKFINSPGMALLAIASWFTQLWSYFAIFAAVAAVHGGAAPTAAIGLRPGLRVVPAAVLAGLLYLLAVMGGTLLLIIPGIYVFGRLQFWPVSLVEDRASPMESLRASWRAVHGHWWRTAIILTVLLIILIVLVMVGGILAGVLAAAGALDRTGLVIATEVFEIAAGFLTGALFPAALIVTYADLKLRREGGDLEARLKELPAA
ncbi:MAG: hypothetical protein JSR73_13805 [Proteobacteria bacterium]|nr:hypothetical protein [Pseudomonadota bacterium]